ncbi:hypothetical protein KNE206_63590 [Kitasatospora sp. NE20-6]|uniref:transposase n=1 Tax=Kitasatospora sp. NE20-6 TaxID=2859066 RepID=UPI0034DBD541
MNQLRSVLISASPRVREPLEALPLPRLIVQCAAEGWSGLAPAEEAVVHTLGSLARRIQFLDAEIKDVLNRMTSMIQATAPELMQVQGIGPDSAAALLMAAGDNPDRLRGEASFAALCGTSPVEASSGKTNRRRLSRGGNRQTNAALFRAVLSRLRWDPATQEYMRRRTTEGLSKREIIRSSAA